MPGPPLLPIDLADNVRDVSGVPDETNGGTGQSTIAQGDLLYGVCNEKSTQQRHQRQAAYRIKPTPRFPKACLVWRPGFD